MKITDNKENQRIFVVNGGERVLRTPVSRDFIIPHLTFIFSML
jgi:hypothetical protein